MARSSYVYLVCPKGEDDVYAVFTVKHEAHTWVDRSEHEFEQLDLHRMKDNPRDNKRCGTREVIPWDYKLLALHRHQQATFRAFVRGIENEAS